VLNLSTMKRREDLKSVRSGVEPESLAIEACSIYHDNTFSVAYRVAICKVIVAVQYIQLLHIFSQTF